MHRRSSSALNCAGCEGLSRHSSLSVFHLAVYDNTFGFFAKVSPPKRISVNGKARRAALPKSGTYTSRPSMKHSTSAGW